jgi:DNA polymerase III subunit beta
MQGFTVKRTEHASLVAKLARIAQGRTTLESLQTIKFDVSEDLIIMTATDLQTAIVVSMNASSTRAGSFCLPAKRYSEMVSGMHGDTIVVSYDAKAEVRSAKSKFVLNGLGGEEFPEIIIPSTVVAEVTADDLARVAGRTTPFVNPDQNSSIGGVHVFSEEGTLFFESSLDHGMAFARDGISNSGVGDIDCTLAHEGMSEFVNMTGLVKVFQDDNKVVFIAENETVVCSKLGSQYPVVFKNLYKTIKGETYSTDRGQLLNVVSEAKLAASKDNMYTIWIQPDIDELYVSVDTEIGTFNGSVAASSNEGVPFGVGADNLKNILSAMPNGGVDLVVSSPTAPVFVRRSEAGSSLYTAGFMPRVRRAK